MCALSGEPETPAAGAAVGRWAGRPPGTAARRELINAFE
jgi:hypothetical protein